MVDILLDHFYPFFVVGNFYIILYAYLDFRAIVDVRLLHEIYDDGMIWLFLEILWYVGESYSIN